MTPRYTNSMHIPWLVIGRSPSTIDYLKTSIKAKQVAPEDITMFIGDDYNSQELFTDDTFLKHASGLSPKT